MPGWIAAVLLSGSPLIAQTETPRAGLPPEVAAAFGRAGTLYTDGSAHAAPFTQIYTPSGFTTARRESGTLWIQSPQRLRFDYGAPEKKTFTYDAGEGRLFTPDDRQLTIQRLSPEERARLPIVFLSDRAPRPELAWLRLIIGKDGTVAELSYEDGSGNRTEFRFEGWQRQKARPGADFRVAGPPGTRILQN